MGAASRFVETDNFKYVLGGMEKFGSPKSSVVLSRDQSTEFQFVLVAVS